MSSEIYQNAFKYEMLIRNVYNCTREMKNGAHMCFMRNAITMEEGKTFAKHLGSFERQFEKVKNHTSKALIKLAKSKPYSLEKDFFMSLENNVINCSTTEQLIYC